MNATENSNNKKIQTQIVSQAFIGPLPHPVILEQYEKICPGAAERILKMAEEQSNHRRTLEAIVIRSNTRNSFWGILSGLLIGIFGLIVVAICAFLGYQGLAGIIATLDICSLVGIFVYGSQQNKKERIEKEKLSGK